MLDWINKAEGSVVFPNYTMCERVADGCIHVIGIAASLVALTVLLVIGVKSQITLWVVSLAIYGAALVAMFSCSAGYNLIIRPAKLKEVFRRLDHAAIFLMIAGTYTPFVLIKMNNAWGLGLLAVVWTIAIIGIVIKLVAPHFLEGLTVGLYLVQGWAIVAAWHPLVAAVPSWVALLLGLGGLLYTVGVVFHLWERLPYQNAIWHGFVLTAASCHYAAVLGVVGV
jgi:hemolysin III